MNTYHGTMHIGYKTYRVTAKADSRESAMHKIAVVAASAFPGKTAKVELVEPEQIGEGAMEFLKNMFFK
jgi:hypothetical protein